jgi:hypothetical protein
MGYLLNTGLPTNITGWQNVLSSRVFPGVYCGKDELKQIDFEREVIYHRQRSEIGYSQSTEGISGCDDYVTISYPLTAVAYVSRSRQSDTNYSPSRLGESLAAVIKETSLGSLLTALEAEDAQIEINSINTSAKSVWENEHENIQFAARQDYILISVEYTITVSASQSCLRKWECYEDVTVTPPEIVITGRTWDSLPGRPVCLISEGLCDLPMWNITQTDINNWNTFHSPVTLGTPNGLSLSGQQLSLGLSSASANGALSSMDWSAFNSKVSSVNGAGPIVVLDVANTGSALAWSGVQLQIPTATNLINGLLSASDRQSFAAKESALTFSTGLTRTVNTITNNLSTGVSGGQSVFGGTGSGESLTLNSTSHATKGKIFFGSASAYDGVNNRLGINQTTPGYALHVAGDVLVGNIGTTTNKLRFGNGTTESNSATIGQTAAGFEIAPGNTSVFRINIPGGASTFYLELYGNGSMLKFLRDGRVDYTPGQTATVNNDHTWHFAGSGTARATASDVFMGVQVGQTLNAGANNQVIDAFRVNSTFANGAFTGVVNNLLRLTGTSSTDVFTVRTGGEFAFKGGTVGLAQTGWGNMANAVANQRTAAYDRNTITLPELADVVNTLATDLRTKGILST